MVFNNGRGRSVGEFSTVEIIEPPVSGNNYVSTLPYLPVSASWTYNAGNPHNFYAHNISGAQQLLNGNVLIANGPSGTFTEIDSSRTEVWKYVNPVSGNRILAQNTAPSQNMSFRCSFYPSDFAGFAWHTLTPGFIIEDVNPLSATCNLSLGILNNSDLSEIKVFPNPTSEHLAILVPESERVNLEIQLFNVLGKSILVKRNSELNGQETVDLRSLPTGVYYLKVKTESEVITEIISKL